LALFDIIILVIVTKKVGSGALSGKMLLIRIVENSKIYAYFTAG